MKLRNILLSLFSVWVLLFILLSAQQYKSTAHTKHNTFFNAEHKEIISNKDLLLSTEGTASLFQICSKTATTTLKGNSSNFNFFVKKYLKSGRHFYAQTFSKNVWISLNQIPAKVLVVLNCAFLI